MKPEEARAWVLIAVRDVIIPIAGVVLAVLLPLTDRFEYWHLPLIAGMLGVPLVARGGDPPKVEMPDINKPTLPPDTVSQEDS
jgi:hypothetical protein